MPVPELERLVAAGLLQREPPVPGESEGLVASAARRLTDAERDGLSLDGRFDLAYNAGHALALAALRRQGYRAAKRYVVFQALEHTLGLPAAKWRVLARCHDVRNRLEYEGLPEVSERLVADLIEIVRELLRSIRELPARPDGEPE